MGEGNASETVPIRAGEVKKGGYVMLKGFPCKVLEVTTSKTGKHGHAKANITGQDIFTGAKKEDSCSTSHNMEAPVVKTTEYSLQDIEDGVMALMDADGEMREDVKVTEEVQTAWDECGDDQEVVVQLMEAVGQVKVNDVKTQDL
eukprot:TRINITY_DN8720_c0_g1_i1.p2 TRINITY_DN8720_c0_g1~~TRINITY_DN8720_c0_g1_i1.p2  ORF type:complete len:145 (+),score=36.20 TRINITY_DN8720_c0_g1_i1:73-507(+)